MARSGENGHLAVDLSSPTGFLTSDNLCFSEARTLLRGWTLRELASGDDRCRSSGLATRRDQLPRRGIRVGALAKRNPNACTNTRFGVPICSLPDVLRRPPMHTGRKSWELLLRNRTWDARRATVGPHLAAISGKLRSLRVSAIGVCSTAPTGVEYFQAGHASSILVTRSRASPLATAVLTDSHAGGIES
jgi:hypothetical protein